MDLLVRDNRLGSILIILAFIILPLIINQNSKFSQLNNELIKFFIIIGYYYNFNKSLFI